MWLPVVLLRARLHKAPDPILNDRADPGQSCTILSDCTRSAGRRAKGGVGEIQAPDEFRV